MLHAAGPRAHHRRRGGARGPPRRPGRAGIHPTSSSAASATSPRRSLEMAELAVAYKNRGVVGLSTLAGAEYDHPPSTTAKPSSSSATTTSTAPSTRARPTGPTRSARRSTPAARTASGHGAGSAKTATCSTTSSTASRSSCCPSSNVRDRRGARHLQPPAEVLLRPRRARDGEHRQPADHRHHGEQRAVPRARASGAVATRRSSSTASRARFCPSTSAARCSARSPPSSNWFGRDFRARRSKRRPCCSGPTATPSPVDPPRLPRVGVPPRHAALFSACAPPRPIPAAGVVTTTPPWRPPRGCRLARRRRPRRPRTGHRRRARRRRWLVRSASPRSGSNRGRRGLPPTLPRSTTASGTAAPRCSCAPRRRAPCARRGLPRRQRGPARVTAARWGRRLRRHALVARDADWNDFRRRSRRPRPRRRGARRPAPPRTPRASRPSERAHRHQEPLRQGAGGPPASAVALIEICSVVEALAAGTSRAARRGIPWCASRARWARGCSAATRLARAETDGQPRASRRRARAWSPRRARARWRPPT